MREIRTSGLTRGKGSDPYGDAVPSLLYRIFAIKKSSSLRRFGMDRMFDMITLLYHGMDLWSILKCEQMGWVGVVQ